jgi:hypothetical protein
MCGTARGSKRAAINSRSENLDGLIDEPKTIDVDAASKLNAEATILGRERCFEDGKSECGMADYHVRLWNAWHHHMALVMMAMLFMLTERLRMKNQCPLLSCADIERLLAAFLPRRDESPEQVLSQMNRRHEMRRGAIESHAKRNAERRFKVT